MGAKITSIIGTISEADLLNDIREGIKTAKVEGLSMETVVLDDELIKLKGVYHKVIDIPFSLAVRILDVHKNILRLKIEEIKVLKLGIPKLALSVATNSMKEKLSELGITYQDETVTVYIDKALEKVKHVKANVEHLVVENGVLAVKVAGIDADIEKMQEEKKIKEKAEEREKQNYDVYSNNAKEVQANGVIEEGLTLTAAQAAREFNKKINQIVSDEDEYTKFRRDLYKKMPSQGKDYYKYLAILPDVVALAVRTIQDKRVLTKDKVILGVTMGYIISPIDIFPDNIPLLGQLDDVALFVFGVNHLVNRIPLPIIAEHWSGDLRTLKFIKDNVGKIMGVVGAGTIDRVYSLVDKKLDKKFGSYGDDSLYFRERGEASISEMIPVKKSGYSDVIPVESTSVTVEPVNIVNSESLINDSHLTNSPTIK